MKKKVLFLIGFMILCFGLVGYFYFTKDIVSYKDEKFENMVKEYLDKSETETINKEDLKRVKKVYLTSVDWLKYLKDFPNLEIVVFNGVKVSVSDLDVASFKNIKELYFLNCKITNQNQIIQFPKLQIIDIQYTEIENTNFLKSFSNVKKVYIDMDGCEEKESHQLNNLKFLQDYKNIEELSLYYIIVENWELISELPNLYDLNVHGIYIKSVKNICKVQNVTTLYVGYITQEVFDEVCNMPNVDSLYMYVTEDLNLSKLEKMNQLSKLSISGYLSAKDNIKNYQTISELTNLIFLDITECNIGNIDNISNLTKLKKLYLVGNHITNQDEIKKMTWIEDLQIENAKE